MEERHVRDGATQHSISAGDQDSRAKLRAGDLSKRGSVVWAVGSGIRAQQEGLFFILSDRRHYTQQLTVDLLV